MHKLEYYVPAEHVDAVNQALFEAGAAVAPEPVGAPMAVPEADGTVRATPLP